MGVPADPTAAGRPVDRPGVVREIDSLAFFDERPAWLDVRRCCAR